MYRLDELPKLTTDFDLILCSNVLEYVQDFWCTLQSMLDRLTPEEVLLLSLPNGRSLNRQVEIAFALTGTPQYYAHVRHAPQPREVFQQLANRGIEILDTRYCGYPPLLSGFARTAGRPELTDMLVVIACRRANRQSTHPSSYAANC